MPVRNEAKVGEFGLNGSVFELALELFWSIHSQLAVHRCHENEGND